MQISRNYKCKDVEMLITAATINESAIKNKTFLQSKRANWADPFFEDFKAEIDKTIEDYLGADSAKQLRESTQIVLEIQANAMKDLAELKTQIDADFKSNPVQKTEILTTLGFNAHYKAVQSKDQEALISLLFQFKTNLTPNLRTKITDQGTAPATLDAIIAHAEQLKNANITQEGFKGTRKEITAEALTAFNAIYDKVINIAVISAKFYKDKPELKDQFSFTKVKNKLNLTKKPNP
ncbi:hypothetical protein [Flavobacterium macrobrachii]|uniref:Uncharacterized protein n=1 Tax=Flavobacterium macrobrachii TaxID=591204 RepID=A0ABS2CSJ9_9FLAO|nr:hypothetical protein [Flavobacterium macrobrachii]MBM6497923.1 hypothetical protein [Flavobacterium macrobrachii]